VTTTPIATPSAPRRGRPSISPRPIWLGSARSPATSARSRPHQPSRARIGYRTWRATLARVRLVAARARALARTEATPFRLAGGARLVHRGRRTRCPRRTRIGRTGLRGGGAAALVIPLFILVWWGAPPGTAGAPAPRPSLLQSHATTARSVAARPGALRHLRRPPRRPSDAGGAGRERPRNDLIDAAGTAASGDAQVALQACREEGGVSMTASGVAFAAGTPIFGATSSDSGQPRRRPGPAGSEARSTSCSCSTSIRRTGRSLALHVARMSAGPRTPSSPTATLRVAPAAGRPPSGHASFTRGAHRPPWPASRKAARRPDRRRRSERPTRPRRRRLPDGPEAACGRDWARPAGRRRERNRGRAGERQGQGAPAPRAAPRPRRRRGRRGRSRRPPDTSVAVAAGAAAEQVALTRDRRRKRHGVDGRTHSRS
jgi:hypothetical protein